MNVKRHILTRTKGMDERKNSIVEDMKQMDGGHCLGRPKKIGSKPVVGKAKELLIFVPQKHLEDPGIDGTSDLWRWRLG